MPTAPSRHAVPPEAATALELSPRTDSADLLRRFFDEAPLLMGVVEVVGDDILHLESNAALAAFFGLRADRMHNRFAGALGFPRRHIDAWLGFYAAAKAAGRPQRFEYTHSLPAPERRLAAVVSHLGASPAGHDRFAFTVEDITPLTRAIEERELTRERLALAVAASNDAIWDWDIATGQAYVSPRYKALLGYRDDEIVIDFAEWSGRLHPDDAPLVRRNLEQHVSEGSDYEHVYRMRHRDGAYRWVRARGAAVRGPDGAARRMVGTVTDITESHAAQRQLEQAFQYAPIGKSMVDPGGRILKVNPALCRITGYTDAELLARTFESITHPDDLECDAVLKADLFAGRINAYQTEKRYLHHDGREIWIRLFVSAVRSPAGAVEAATGLVEDISQTKAAENALRRGLAERDAALQREKTLLRELDHRVRNNLSGLMGLLRIYGRSDETRDGVVSGMVGKVRALTEVHDLIAGAPRRTLNLRELVERLRRDLLPGAPARPAAETFRAAGPDVDLPPLAAAALAMILQELFANSLKHGALALPGGAVELEWNCPAAASPAHDRALELVWCESAPTAPAPAPSGNGIGLKLIEGLARSELRGSAAFSFSPPGFACRIEGALASDPRPADQGPTP